jgi:hypothetical protein
MRSSPFFAFAAVLVADEDEAPLRAALSTLRQDFNVPSGKPLHWKDHVKTFSRRQHATKTLVAVPNIMLIYVLVEKAAIPATAHMVKDQAIFYNYAAGLVVERVLLAARGWPGGPRTAVVRFGHVRGFDHTTTANYLDLRVARNDPSWLPWHLLNRPVHFDSQAKWDGLQAADQFAGMLAAAIRADEFGNHEPQHFLVARPLIRCVNGNTMNYGFKLLGNPATPASWPWWGNANI